MRAARGAIDHIRLADANRVSSYSTIGSSPPLGLSGTAYVDLIAEMLRVGVINKTGNIDPEAAPQRIQATDYGGLQYEVNPSDQTGHSKPITVGQEDISNVLRAKGAIYAGIHVLLRALSLTLDDVAEIMVAGAFGNFLDLRNTVFIGLLPDIPLERIRFVGNTSLAGAKLAAFSQHAYEETLRIADRTTYFELCRDPHFVDQFVAACFFPHTNVELFPSVIAELASRKDT
jgi:uncharacterized 2Fe-2S/4Fe-4S cluster protein (DUF4445 family)